MLKNEGRYTISQGRIKKTQIFAWIWYEFVLLLAALVAITIAVFSLPIALNWKISIWTTVSVVLLVLFAQIDEFGGSPYSVIKKIVKYKITSRRFLFKPRKGSYER
ncbi:MULTISPECIES: hypothetical protein [Erysipelothrix]|uniref:hypothetical protein n=1 Tax=Erysipelothrix TaxID=1647 RepID=UPI001358D1E4|nr:MULTISPECIES: hypothetical protein [Erysipelothrix]